MNATRRNLLRGSFLQPFRTFIPRRLVWSLLVVFVGVRSTSAQLSPAESLKSLRPAEGFEVSLWAHEPMLSNPTGMDVDSRGRVWVAEGLNYRLFENKNRGTDFKRIPGADRIKILEDTDSDGIADKVTVFAADIFPMPLGLAVQEIWQDGRYRGARVYVGYSADLLVLEDTDGDDRADRRYPLLSGFRGIDTEHGLHGMALGPDGKLYFTQGDSRYGTDKVHAGETTFDIVDKSGRRLTSAQMGTALRVNLDGTGFEALAYRMRNNYEACVSSFGHVFVSDNDDDGDLGCRMLWIMPGGNYGYQTPGSSRQWAEELPGIVPKLVGTGNGGPTGILVYEGDLFGKEYQGAVLQLDAGTHQVNFHPLKRHGAAFRSEYRVLLRGEDSWFRPVDAAVAPDGSLFVCDWYDAGVGAGRLSDQTTGRLYSLRPAGSQPRARKPDFASPAGLIAALKSPNVATRFAARQGLLAQGNKAREAVSALFRDGRPHERARALFVLADLAETGRADTIAALKDADPQIRELALRILVQDVAREAVVAPESARTVEPPAARLLGEVLPLAEDPDAGVRRELLLALRHVQTSKAGEALLKLAAGWDGKDRYYLEALCLALKDREPDFLTKLFSQVTRPALADGWGDEPVALPPYYPITTNDAFLRIGDELPPGNAASKVIGLAWVLQRPEALAALRAILAQNDSPALARGADIALTRLDDPRAAELFIDRFLAQDDPERQREILRRLGSKLAKAWKPVRETDKMQKVFQSALASDELRVEAIKTIARCGAVGYEGRLMELAGDERQEHSTRAAALESLGRLRYGPARDMAARLVEHAKGEQQAGPLALAALSALSYFQGRQAQQLLERVFDDLEYPLDFRRRAVQVLSATWDGANRLLAIHRQKRLPEDLTTEVTFLLHNHADRRIRRAARREIPLPKTASGKRIADLKEVLALDGDARRGREIFYRDRSDACGRCHRVQGTGNWVGPDLSSVGTKYGKSELLYHILNPSGAINYNYVTYTLALADGRVLTGLITAEETDRLVLKTATGERLVIPSDEIEMKRAQNISIMPENLVETLTEQDLADLIAYLATLRQPVSSLGEYYVLGPLSAGSYDGATKPDLKARPVGPAGRPLRWRHVQTGRDQHLDLSALLGSKEGLEAYLFVPLVSDRTQHARLVLNTAHAVSLWLNGHRVRLAEPRKTGANTLWEGPLKLQAGANDLVIRVASNRLGAGLVTTLITDRAIHFSFDVPRSSRATSR